MKTFSVSLLFLASVSTLHAAPTPFGAPTAPSAGTPAAPSAPAVSPPAAPPPTSSSPAAAPAATSSTSGDYSSGTAERTSDKIFDVNRDSVDLETGTLRWKDKSFSLGDSKVLRARLERYLASPAPSNDTVQHAKILAEIETLLSPQKITRQNFNKNYQRAWDLLFKAGEFESDGENSLTIASQVMKVYRDKQEARKLLISQKQQELDRKYQSERTIARARVLERQKDLAANRSIASAAPRSNAKGGSPAAAPSGGGGGAGEHSEGTADLEEHRNELSKIDASIKKTEAARSALEWKSRLEFQSQIVSLLFQRRWQHAGIATAFYRHTYDDSSSQELRVGEKEIKSMFPVSNFSPTLDTVDALARTARSDVTTGIKAVKQLYDSGRRYKAFERLQETFFLGEYTQEIMFFDPEKKTVLLELWQDLQLLQKVGDERDLDAVETQLKKIATVATDFPSAQVESRVRNAKRASNLALFAAKQSAFANDPEKSAAHLEKATKLWPQNPAIEEFTRTLEGRADALTRLVPEFDALHKEKRFREIFKRKEAFGLALARDAERSVRLKESLDLTAKIEGAVMQARILKESGNPTLAWDALEEAFKLDSTDEVLMAARMALVAAVGDYANKLSRAASEEAAGRYGASLSWYLSAQEKNPSSEIIRKGMSRVGAKLLETIQKERGGN